MVWSVTVMKPNKMTFGYIAEATTINEAIDQFVGYGVVIGAQLSEEMNDELDS